MSKNKSRGLLYPAIHKFYNALKSLEQFDKGKDLFQNISHLDNFFTEYRNITFALQKSLAHTEYIKSYEKYRDKYLINKVGAWFVKTRNTITKEGPFELQKKVIITIYSTIYSSVQVEKVFTIENDVKYSTLIESLKSFINIDKAVEVYFSVKFSFYEKEKDKELFGDFIKGIENMNAFLNAMRNVLNEKCELCNRLQREIDKMNFYKIPGDMIFVDDYIYYVKDNEFEKAERLETLVGFSNHSQPVTSLSNQLRFPLSSFIKKYNKKKIKGKSASDVFIYLHLTIFNMQNRIMPVFMIVYKDMTCELITFDASIKTTLYRKINEIADRVEQDKIKAVFLCNEVIHYFNEDSNYKDIMELNSKERMQYITSESLGFFMAYEDLRYHTYLFDTSKIRDMQYVKSVINNSYKNTSLSSFYHPILNEFKRLKSNM